MQIRVKVSSTRRGRRTGGIVREWDSRRSVARFRSDKTVSEQNMVEKHLPDRHGDHIQSNKEV